ncbi:hypothetical protein TREMEDRAFT_63090 [Tremella mesenterica DSM 1558]|uniref:uncharacterized protein n=1 Tax=Tremella mesenterica (strain ATCC 24925 / CBS 8224 / DSM 1558 / NBRC 9311 / NRRL Y-6157 / RJB 2259-6 / UBC 559-6) TaxID=578456 RepID=UPI0003F49632|nr:uncharacterized protein TREMEDRAFT_63090 [Tremella mesenterica DSM 1558]EIW68623.1 hypothetical protein TREMEDRAFT_63090 [Tremella mesenterica DSM 1558]
MSQPNNHPPSDRPHFLKVYVEVMERDDSIPFLLGPPSLDGGSGIDGSDFDSDISFALTSPSTSSPTSTQEHKTSSSIPTLISSIDVSHSPSFSSTPTSTDTDTITQSPSQPPDAIVNTSPIQPSSIRFLVPIFLLFIITVGVCIYRKIRVIRMRRIDRQSRSSIPSPSKEKGPSTPDNIWGKNGGWKEIKDDNPWDGASDDEMVYEEKVGYVSINNGEMEYIPELTKGYEKGIEDIGGVVSAGNLGWGWRDTFRSARGKERQNLSNQDDQDVEREEGIKDKVRLIRLVKPRTTPQEQYSLDGTLLDTPNQINPLNPLMPPTGSLRRLRERILSWTTRKPITNIASNLIPSDPTSNDHVNSVNLDDGNIICGQGEDSLDGKLERNKSPNKRRQMRHVPPEAPEWIRPRMVSPPSTSVLSPPMQPHLFFATNLDPRMGSTYTPPQGSDSESEYSMPSMQGTPVPEQGIDGYTPTPGRVTRKRSEKEGKNGVERGLSKVSKTSRGSRIEKREKSTRRREKEITGRRTDSQKTSGRERRESKKDQKEDQVRDEVAGILRASWTDRALASPQATEVTKLNLGALRGQSLDAAAHLDLVGGDGDEDNVQRNEGSFEEGDRGESVSSERGDGIQQRLGL